MLVLRLTHPKEQDVTLASFADKNSQTASWETVSWTDAHKRARQSNQLIVLIPAKDVQLTQSNLKARSQRQIAQALPFALEEQLIGEPEQQHYVWFNPKDNEDEHFPVAIIEHQRLQQWVAFLRQHGLNTRYILPDVFMLPIHPEGVSLWQQDQITYIRQNTWQGFSAPSATLDLYLQQLQQTVDTDAFSIRLYQAQEKALNHFTGNIIQDAINDLTRSSIEVVLPLSLSQNFVSESSTKFSQVWKPWRGTAIAAVMLGLVLGGIQFIEIQKLSQQQSKLTQSNLNQFSQLFPELRERDPFLLRSAAKSQVAALSQGNQTSDDTHKSALPLLATLAKILPQQSGITVKNMAWNNNRLTTRLETASSQSIERLEKLLSKQFNKTINIDYRRNGNRIQANLVLEADSQ